ncbi:MAG: hypothetical protein K6G88_06400, partial [Lachnospiraceae bacterium]|nr:hypothetical protein [Lachnospiraceae bacterium]
KKTYYSKYSKVFKYIPKNEYGKYTISTETAKGVGVDSVILKITSDKYNDITYVDAGLEWYEPTAVYNYQDENNNYYEYYDVRCESYSFDNITWKPYNDMVLLEAGKTIYVKLKINLSDEDKKKGAQVVFGGNSGKVSVFSGLLRYIRDIDGIYDDCIDLISGTASAWIESAD